MSDKSIRHKVGDRFTPALLIVLILMPLTHLMGAVQDDGTVRERAVGIGSWVIVTVVTALIAVALNRILVNVRWHRRPFTEKDYQYCLRAFYASLFGAAFLVVYDLVELVVTDKTERSEALSDVLSMQSMYLLVVAAILSTLAYAHRKGARLYEELEKGV